MTAGVTITADGFEAAMIGSFLQPGGPMLAVYSIQRCLDILMQRDGMTEEEADEFMEFNVIGAYCGPGTPLYVDDRWRRWGTVHGPLDPPMLEETG